MKKSVAFSILGMALLSGCAKGPSGPVAPVSRNRLTVSMTMEQPISSAFYYDFAFDDDGDPSDGPTAIIGTTLLTNGVVGGSFSVLVQYRGGQFIVFRRTDLGNGQERLERASNAFVVPPTAGGTTIQFTLDLDATIDAAANPPTDADRLFKAGATRLDLNFVTTPEIIRDPNNLAAKPFDALGPPGDQFVGNVDIASTRTYRNGDGVTEPTGDLFVPIGHPISQQPQQQAQLEITDFTIGVQRLN